MKMLSIAAIAFVVAGIAGAVEDSTAKPAPSAAQAEQEAKPVGTRVDTFGKVVGIHSCPIVGVAAPHMLVKLETEQGDIEIVDLGSTEELKNNGIEPKQGQQFWVDGRVGKVNDKFLIVAERLSETKMITIARTASLREETVKHADARVDGKEVKDGKDGKDAKTEAVDAGQKVRTVEGTVIHTRRVKIEGEVDEHVLAKIQTEKGIAVIDLGTSAAIPYNVSICEGRSLAATGFVGHMNGKPIILADSVGNLSPIQRPTERETIPTGKSER